MSFVMAILEVSGPRDYLRTVDEHLGLQFYGQPMPLKSGKENESRAMLVLTDEVFEEHAGVSFVIDWLKKNGPKLIELSGRKVLEVQCGLESTEASRFLTFSLTDLQVIAEVGCALRIQYMQSSPGV